ncbi:ComEA family DNA-binding protein [Candidatus Viridilinea mediisalina]|uniref:Soluble ligand binding domain-containing protein n=1 Tax=Candidatus Viridilinea mediisalina TaxID=2024553 RepID=A0A2A6RGE8_9CHLR|nr:ComEA family DNA-binding protein [Candidatus Viridilinea mediisalina]PDW02013.1 hypothetical protein CJ255_16215 [Candidatus Viridilinea mediisalina]
MEWNIERNPRMIAALVCLLLGVVVLGFGFAPYLGLNQAAPPAFDDAFDDFVAVAPPAPTLPVELIVYVSGSVNHPDVYRLPEGARVKDAIVAAGGFREDAATDQINLAAPLSDAGHIHIPMLVASDSPEAAVVAVGSAAAPQGPQLININRASQAELQSLPGIGAVLAERIVTRRETQGPFGSIEELRSVSGIGDKLYAQLEPLVSAGP